MSPPGLIKTGEALQAPARQVSLASPAFFSHPSPSSVFHCPLLSILPIPHPDSTPAFLINASFTGSAPCTVLPWCVCIESISSTLPLFFISHLSCCRVDCFFIVARGSLVFQTRRWMSLARSTSPPPLLPYVFYMTRVRAHFYFLPWYGSPSAVRWIFFVMDLSRSSLARPFLARPDCRFFTCLSTFFP